MRLRFVDEDRERFGITDEWLKFDLATVSIREAIALQKLGYANPKQWLLALDAQPLVENGQPVYEVDGSGEPILDDSGKPVQRRRIDYLAWALAGWIVLRRHGLTLDFEDCDFDIARLRIDLELPEPVPEATDEGKDPAAQHETPTGSTTT